MARYSDPSQSESASLNRFYVWNSASDPYSYEELAKNWDRVDAMIGRPTGNSSAWPPTQGVGGGIWREIQMLSNGTSDIGDIKMWWYPFSGSETYAQIEARLPVGWVICDGRKVLAADHEFPGISTDIYVPDFVNRVPVGAALRHVNESVDSLVAPGTAGTTVTSSTETMTRANSRIGAPGLVRTGAPYTTGADGVVRATNIGETGTNVLPNVAVPIPDHFHDMDHVHVYSGRTQRIDLTTSKQNNVSYNSGRYWLRESSQGENSSSTWDNFPIITKTVTHGTMTHDHTVGFDVSFEGEVVSRPRGSSYENIGTRYVPGSADTNIVRRNTSYQIKADGAQAAPGRYSKESWPGQSVYNPGTAGGSSLNGSVNIDRRQLSIGVLFLIKVKNADAV